MAASLMDNDILSADAVDLSLMTIVASFTPMTCIVFVYCYNYRIYNFH